MAIPILRAPPSSSKKITDDLVDIRKDGSILLNMEYFDYATGLKMANEAKWEQLFGSSSPSSRSLKFLRSTWIWRSPSSR